VRVQATRRCPAKSEFLLDHNSEVLGRVLRLGWRRDRDGTIARDLNRELLDHGNTSVRLLGVFVAYRRARLEPSGHVWRMVGSTPQQFKTDKSSQLF
jgi:hypothetical protein